MSNFVTSLQRDFRKDLLVPSNGNEHSSQQSSTSPSLNQSSPSPLSPSILKPSPNPSHSSTSPLQSSPRPLLSPRSSNVQPSPVPSPLPTFLDSEFREAAGIKIKTEKNILTQEECSIVKPVSNVILDIQKILYFCVVFRKLAVDFLYV